MNLLQILPNVGQTIGSERSIALKANDPRHIDTSGRFAKDLVSNEAKLGGFGQMVFDALGKTNNQILDGQLLSQQAIVSPDSVDKSTLVVALVKANMSINLTKSVIDRASSAYKELTTIR